MKRAPEHLRFAAMAVDAVVFAVLDGTLKVLVAEVNSASPYKGLEAFPGGLIRESETAEDAIVRVLKEKADITPTHVEQLYTFSALERDKRDRVVSVAYLAFVSPTLAEAYTHPDAHFVPVKKVGQLGYDHNEILAVALARVRGKITYTNLAQFLLPRHFTLSELQFVYELILGTELDKRNFRKKIIALDLVKETGTKQEGVKNRPALLYEFTSRALKELPLII